MLRTQKSTDCSPVPPTRALWKTRGKQMGRKQVVGPPRGHSGKESACQSWRRKTRMIDPGLKKIPWRRAWQPTPVFLPGESHGQRSLAGSTPWCCQESDSTEVTCTAQYQLEQKPHVSCNRPVPMRSCDCFSPRKLCTVLKIVKITVMIHLANRGGQKGFLHIKTCL